MGIENFAAFFITALIFVITPGMDTIFVLNKSIARGKRSGVYAGLGINTGVLVHTCLGALGLSVVIAKSPMGFLMVKYIGALYILYLGIMGFRSKKDVLIPENTSAGNQKKGDFWSGFITNVLNPKVALFFIAFFPQFILQDQMQSPVPFIVLGVTYAVIGIVWLVLLACCAGIFTDKIRRNPKIGLRINKLTGLIFIGMAVTMVVIG